MTRALLVVDIQQGLIDLKPTNTEVYLTKVNQAISHFRDSKEEVIFVQHTEKEGLLALNSPNWQLYAGLDVQPQDTRIQKYFNSAFRRTNLEDYLNKQGIDHLVVCGMQVEYCLNATLTVGFEKEIKLTILADAVTTFDRATISGQEIIDFYTQTIWPNFGNLISVDQL
ncbi:cysteine hydrolase family protein [Streptococcus saliviloxodontae]|uniref:Nicotinamidase-related amidase n=1 Tax=Streptococcus saliviloxodontae TaxID=1349416 RepID=A0ABS2PNI8_9STRE|nr:cysteine hydrolase family protein [Streptococcus saliviloxodontae]MBM7636941.1 nicotinamidase-related amidase [Streptococcus saliviloxodontae]